tara:strand:+ start:4987 stop:5496 length:510 start_codon:yes stop_codon:yes gene_type:complete
MAEVKTDVAVELDITARRADTLKLSLEVRDPITTNLLDLSGVQDVSKPKYQAKMSILDSSRNEVLSVYSYYWVDAVPGSADHVANTPPSPSSVGHFSGSSSTVQGINLIGQTASSGSVIVNIPNTHTKIPSGDYVYDLQVRFMNSSTSTAEYNTWLFGKLTITADVTKI